MNKCSWCNTESNSLKSIEINGDNLLLCKSCYTHNENHECITCGETIFDTLAINGECTGCMQIRSAESEKKRSEALMGLGLSTISELTESVIFTEDDYNKWVTFGQGNYSPEKYKSFRKAWMKSKIVRGSGWTDQEFEDNYLDVEKIMNNNLSTVFRSPCLFILSGKNKQKAGAMVLAQSGKVKLMKVDSTIKK